MHARIASIAFAPDQGAGARQSSRVGNYEISPPLLALKKKILTSI